MQEPHNIKEARIRVRCGWAEYTNDAPFPAGWNPSPEHEPSHDLGALALVLEASGKITSEPGTVYGGEVGLDGKVRSIRGAHWWARRAEAHRIPTVLPAANASEVIGRSPQFVRLIGHVRDLVRSWDELDAPPLPAHLPPETHFHSLAEAVAASPNPNLGRVAEEAMALIREGRAVCLVGRPGSGMTMLARGLCARLAPTREMLEDASDNHSWAGLLQRPLVDPPFRAPHHTVSRMGIEGSRRRPGEIHLAHGGMLFLDQVPEFPRDVIDAVRPVGADFSKDRAGPGDFPARPLAIVGSAWPCPCGYAGSPRCTCTRDQITRYLGRIPPWMTRVNMETAL